MTSSELKTPPDDVTRRSYSAKGGEVFKVGLKLPTVFRCSLQLKISEVMLGTGKLHFYLAPTHIFMNMSLGVVWQSLAFLTPTGRNPITFRTSHTV